MVSAPNPYGGALVALALGGAKAPGRSAPTPGAVTFVMSAPNPYVGYLMALASGGAKVPGPSAPTPGAVTFVVSSPSPGVGALAALAVWLCEPRSHVNVGGVCRSNLFLVAGHEQRTSQIRQGRSLSRTQSATVHKF